MGRKSRFDRRNRPGSSYGKKHREEDFPKRERTRTRSPSPDRRRDESPYPRRQQRIDESSARSPSPSRGRGYSTSRYSPAYQGRPSASTYVRNISRSPSPQRRREQSRPPADDYRRGERYVSRASPSRSPSPSRDRNKQKKWSSKKPRYDKKNSKRREKDKYSKSNQRTHDVYKPGPRDGSSPPSRGRAWSPQGSSPRRSLTPSPRRDRPSTSGSGRPSYNSHPPTSPAYDTSSRWQQASERISSSRYPPLPDQSELYQEHRPQEYTRQHPPSQPRRYQSPISARANEESSTQDYDDRNHEKGRQERRNRPRGQDYDRDEWEKTHKETQKRSDEPRSQESRYYSDIPEPRSSYNKYPTLPEPQYPQFPDSQNHSESTPRRRTPQGPRASYEDPYWDQYPYERRRSSYEQPTYPPTEVYPRPPSPPPLPPQPTENRFEEGSRKDRARYKEFRRSPPPIPRDEISRRPEALPPPPIQNGFRNPVNIEPPPPPPPPPSADPIASAPTGLKLNGGIRPFTLKGNVLKNLKRAHDPEHESDRLFKAVRTSPRHVSAPAPPKIMPPPLPVVEIQQTQTPETPSNREGLQERRVATKEKGASMFERIGQVGEGTYGKVYKARNTLTGELVALKKIRMEAERDGFPITAMREIKLLESLRHPNVVHLQEMMFEKSFIYMVFEYMDHDLAGILTHPQFTFRPAHIKELLRQMLEGLHYLHHRGILHRDIKGSNILLNADGQLKLADFGLARHYHKHRANLDYTNRVITLWYRPPELLLGATAYGPAVDIWSIGCIMLEMVTKKAIFPGHDEIDQLVRIWDVMGSPTSETWPKVTELPWWELVKPQTIKPERFREDYADVLSKEGLSLVFKLLSLNPERRPTAAEALQHPYFTTELPKPERPTGLVLDGEWHEFESKQRKRAQRAQEHRKGSQSTMDSSHR